MEQLMDEQAGLAYLRTFPDFERGNVSATQAFGLERVLGLLDELGAPHLRLPVIHLAGTKGKGSTAAMLASVLRAGGYRTGLFTQPHLMRLHERFQIDGTQITDAELTEIMLDWIRPAVERLQRRGLAGIQQFEAQVALAFLWFLQCEAEVVVLETGLGGRLDGTNVVPQPLATVLTPIGHDHMSVLGNTLAQIAGEKAAIIKPGVPAIAAPQPSEAAHVFVETARTLNAPLLLGERDWVVEVDEVGVRGTRFNLTLGAAALSSLDEQTRRWKEPVSRHVHVPGVHGIDQWGELHGDRLVLPDLFTPLLGAHQAVNAGAAALTALVVSARLPHFDAVALRRGLAQVEWPGRLQVIAHDPTIVLDGAHTAESADALATAMLRLFPGRRIILVLGIQGDKDIPSVVYPLAAIAQAAIATRAQHQRAALPSVVGAALQAAGCSPVEECADSRAALAQALQLAAPDDVILVAGSLYLAGEVLAEQSVDE